MGDKITKMPFTRNNERHFLLFFNGINGYSFIPPSSLCGCIGRCMFCLSLSNCSLNHSTMGFWSIAKTNLVPPVRSFTT